MNNYDENYIEHEVKIRVLQERHQELTEVFKSIDRRFDKIEMNMKSNFHWVLGTILAQIAMTITLFGGVILHMAKLI